MGSVTFTPRTSNGVLGDWDGHEFNIPRQLSSSASGWYGFYAIRPTGSPTVAGKWGAGGPGNGGAWAAFIYGTGLTSGGTLPVGVASASAVGRITNWSGMYGNQQSYDTSCQSMGFGVPATPTVVGIQFYIRALTLTYTGTGYDIHFTWNVSVTGAAGTSAAYTSGVTATGAVQTNPVADSVSSETWRCGLGCGNAGLIPPFTLHIVDNGRNQEATYVFGANGETGTLIADIQPPRVSYVTGCYNATANSCGANQAATFGTFRFRLVPMGATSTAEVVICKRAIDADGCLDGGTNWGVSGAAGDVEYVSPLMFMTTGDYQIVAANAAGRDVTIFSVQAGTFGAQGSSQTTPGCGVADVGCWLQGLPAAIGAAVSGALSGIGSLISSALSAAFVPSAGSTAAFSGLGTTLQSKEPFATFFGATNALSSALASAGGSSSLCWTWSISVGGHGSPWVICTNAVTSLPGWGVAYAVMQGGIVLMCATYFMHELAPRPVVAG
jgi:hypothetical protein